MRLTSESVRWIEGEWRRGMASGRVVVVVLRESAKLPVLPGQPAGSADEKRLTSDLRWRLTWGHRHLREACTYSMRFCQWRGKERRGRGRGRGREHASAEMPGGARGGSSKSASDRVALYRHALWRRAWNHLAAWRGECGLSDWHLAAVTVRCFAKVTTPR